MRKSGFSKGTYASLKEIPCHKELDCDYRILFDKESIPFQYEFNYDLSRGEFNDVKDVDHVLGYATKLFTLSFFLKLLHPDEQFFFIEAIKNSVIVLSSDQNNIRENYLYASYRLKRSNGEYAFIVQRSYIDVVVEGIACSMRNICVDISVLGLFPILSVKCFSSKRILYELSKSSFFSMNVIELSRQELIVLELVAGGLHCAEIAKKLGISIHTVHTHRRNILRKTKSQNIIEAISRVNGNALFLR